jgi:hypothetical protein
LLKKNTTKPLRTPLNYFLTVVPVETSSISLLYGHYILEISIQSFQKPYLGGGAQLVAEEVAHVLP